MTPAADLGLSRQHTTVMVTALVGVTVGVWVGYVLVYPLSAIPLPKHTMLGVGLLGVYVDYFADEMIDRIVMLLGAAGVAYVTAFVVYTLPALAGWYSDPIVQQALLLRGLKRVFIFWSAALVLLIAGTFVSYLVRSTYLEITR